MRSHYDNTLCTNTPTTHNPLLRCSIERPTSTSQNLLWRLIYLYQILIDYQQSISFFSLETDNFASSQNLTVSDVKVFINVVRALDIPVRDDVQPAG